MKIRFWILLSFLTTFLGQVPTYPYITSNHTIVYKEYSFGLYTFTESDIILKTSTGNIDGTLLCPNTDISTSVVLIIAGSGPTDRDCNSPGMKTNAYKQLAEELAMNGIASVRYDKRGIAKSQIAGMKESDLRFENYVDDAAEWIKMLGNDKRFSGIYIIGHSEGSLIGMIATEKVKVKGFISIAGAGRPADQLIMEQIKDQPDIVKEETKTILESLKKGNMVFSVSSYLESLFRTSVQPYMISWLKYDPAKEIKNVKSPVLIIQGSTDIQVSMADAKLLAASKPGSRLVIIDKMNHIFKESGSDRQENLATYSKPDLSVKQELVNEIIKFIRL
jgi:uncharacterized protein